MNAAIRETAEAVVRTTSELQRLSGKHILVTGGTGFIGTWLLETLASFNDQQELPCKVYVPTRNPQGFRQRAPHLAARADITLIHGEIGTFDAPDIRCDYIIHAAAPASPLSKAEMSVDVGTTIVEGTRRILDLARLWEPEGMLFLSSGAVYGTQPPDMSRVAEGYRGGPDLGSPFSTYAEGKRYAEVLCVAYQQAYHLPITIARPFTFVGPYQDLDAGFAVTDFIRDALKGQTLRIKGDGTTVRSFCGSEDLLRMLWGVLFRGLPGQAYNVGSDAPISILELAREVAQTLEHPVDIEVAQLPVPGALPARYVPDISRLREEIGLYPTVPFEAVIRQTVTWASERVRPTS